MDRWIGKVAIVTGASSGIGAATAERLVREGLTVVGFARRQERVQKLAEKLKGVKGSLYTVKVDITNESEIIKGFDLVKRQLGPIHILINNAGIARNTTLIDGESYKWKEVLDTNVLGLCVATREAIRDMRKNNIDGHIVHINSIAGYHVLNLPALNVYNASKHAVTALTETLRRELIDNNLKIKITSVNPGLVETEIFETSGYDTTSLKDIPLLKPEDIADAIIYVLSTPPRVQVHAITIKPIGERV